MPLLSCCGWFTFEYTWIQGKPHGVVLLGTHRRYRSVGNISSVWRGPGLFQISCWSMNLKSDRVGVCVYTQTLESVGGLKIVSRGRRGGRWSVGVISEGEGVCQGGMINTVQACNLICVNCQRCVKPRMWMLYSATSQINNLIVWQTVHPLITQICIGGYLPTARYCSTTILNYVKLAQHSSLLAAH